MHAPTRHRAGNDHRFKIKHFLGSNTEFAGCTGCSWAGPFVRDHTPAEAANLQHFHAEHLAALPVDPRGPDTSRTESTPDSMSPKIDAPKLPKKIAPLIIAAIVVLMVTAGALFNTYNTAQEADGWERLSDMQNAADLTTKPNDKTATLVSGSKPEAFRADPVFKSPEWAAYTALSNDRVKDAHENTLKYLQRQAAEISVERIRHQADAVTATYQERMQSGDLDLVRRDTEFANTVLYVQQVCKAKQSGQAPADYIAGWQLRTADPEPYVHLNNGISVADAEPVIRTALTAAMTAGVKYYCP